MLAACLVLWLGLLLTLPPRPSAWVVVLSGLPLLLVYFWQQARRHSMPAARWIRQAPDQVGLALVLLYGVGTLMADSHGISTDGVTYFAQLRSVLVDGDLDLSREFAHLGQPPRPHHVVPIGPTLVWAPLYLLVRAIDTVGRAIGAWPPPADATTIGLGLPYVRAALLSSYAAGAAGLWLLLLHLRTRFSPGVAATTVVLLFGATPLFWYMVYEPSMTHAVSFGFVAAFAVASARWVPAGATRRHSVILGTLLGLAFAARSQDALFALLPGLLVVGSAAPWRERLPRALSLAGWALVGALPWLALQALHSYVLFTRYDFTQFGQGGYFNPWQSRWLDTLFSSWHGFFSWTPVAYIAALGTVAYLRREWQWATAALVVLFLTAWVNGATQDWAAGWSFGGRRFASVLVLLAPGLALTVEGVLRRPLVALAPVVVGALWWNHLLMVQYASGLLPKDEPVSFGRVVRQQAELHTRAPYRYPFAFPANALFAWRTGVGMDKYDLLGPEVARESFETKFDRTAEKFLVDGWSAPGGDDWGPQWWIGESTATLLVPMTMPESSVNITVRSRTRLDDPPVQAALALDVNGTQVGQFAAGVPDPTVTTISVPAGLAAKVFKPGFNQIALRSLGVSRYTPGNTALPDALVKHPDQVWPVAIYELRIGPAR